MNGQTVTIKESERLYGLGFAIHWVRPKSKVPVESGWTTGKRHPWNYLQKTYSDGLNVGVRLGEASQVGENFLACIDVDVKTPKFKAEALECLKQIVGDKKLPTVLSGSGNGSRHLYCVTKAPFKMITVGKSEGTFLDAEGRKHHDWEVCVYSSGRQMVLPPSTHPQTGKHYEWARALSADADLPVMEFEKFRANRVEPVKSAGDQARKARGETDFEFTPVEVDLDQIPISDKVRAAIVTCAGVEDRSTYLHVACEKLLTAGLARDEILSVLTDKNYSLGNAALDRRPNRRAAAQWLYQYYLHGKMNPALEAAHVFSAPIEENRKLTPEEKEAQTSELGSEGGFYKLGPRGSSVPDYDKLLNHFASLKPYKSVSDLKSIYAFNGKHYETLSMLEIKAFAEENFSPKPTERMRCEFYSKVVSNNLAPRDFFKRLPEKKINLMNGVLDLDSWDLELLPHSADYNFSYVLPYDFDPEADCPFFRNWIDGVMLGDEKLVAILQEFMGYIVRGGEYSHHKALWLEGIGRNGKSTFIDVLKALVGSANYSTVSIKALVGDRFAGAALEGKIANFSEETSPSELRDSGPFKNLTGDGEISAQRKFEGSFYFRNRAKLVMTYNTIPNLSDLSPGMLSRPIIVPFRKTIRDHEQDKNIKAKIIAELPGIFNFALEGWERLEKQNGFTESPHSSLALTKVKEESCNVFQWVELYVDFLVEDVGTFTPSRDFYSAYKRSEKFAYGSSEFFRRLRKHPKMKERYRESNGKNGYKSVKIIG